MAELRQLLDFMGVILGDNVCHSALRLCGVGGIVRGINGFVLSRHRSLPHHHCLTCEQGGWSGQEAVMERNIDKAIHRPGACKCL